MAHWSVRWLFSAVFLVILCLGVPRRCGLREEEDEEMAVLKGRLRNPPVDCLYWPKARVISRETLFGQPVVVLQKTYKMENIRITKWLAPQLGCESLQWRLETQQPDGSYKLEADEKLISLEMKEPDPFLFAPGAHYEEVLPSEIIRRALHSIGVPESPESQQHGERAGPYLQQYRP